MNGKELQMRTIRREHDLRLGLFLWQDTNSTGTNVTRSWGNCYLCCNAIQWCRAFRSIKLQGR